MPDKLQFVAVESANNASEQQTEARRRIFA